jgi:hypothetical protein
MKIVFFDFDGCIMNSPKPEEGKAYYEKVHGTPYPHIGWWARKESLCMDTFDIQPFPAVDKVLRFAMADPYSRAILLTSRIGKMEQYIRAVLDKQGYTLDSYTFSAGKDNKGERMRKILEMSYPDALETEFYDDDPKHLLDAKIAMSGHKIKLKLFRVDNGEIVEM